MNSEQNQNLVSLFIRSSLDGSLPAVSSDREAISYAELKRRSAALASVLQAEGVSRDTPVAVLLERSVDFVVAIVAVMRAGGAYVPLDPALPDERIRFILTDCAAPVLLTKSAFSDTTDFSGCKIEVDRFAGECEWQEVSPVDDDLAYVIYTSGSTGTPKGVLCHHRGAVNMLKDGQSRTPLGPGDRCSWWTSAGFDVSVYEIFSALTTGAELVIVPPEIRTDGTRFSEWLAVERITAAYLPPMMVSSLEGWLRRYSGRSSLRRVLTGVEPIPERLLIGIAGAVPGLHIINGYGPTEAAVYCTAYHLMNAGGNPSRMTPIGKPLDGVEIRLADEKGNPVPDGEPGEIWIGGVQVERGYLNSRHLTRTAFADGWYRSGDLAVRLPDGNLMFRGRADNQIKFLGHRIELGEVETALSRIPDIQDTVVSVFADEAVPRLIAYYTARYDSAPDAAALRKSLENELPTYMIPSLYIRLPSLPMTVNGKADRKALPPPSPEDLEQLRAGEYRPPVSSEQREVAEVFAELLSIPMVGLDDDFFLLGGHSLLATQALSRLGGAISLQEFYSNPTVAGLAGVLSEAEEKGILIPAAPAAERYPLTASQHTMWMMHYTGSSGTLSNIPGVTQISGPLNIPALRRALNEIICRHDALRMVFSIEDGDVYQRPADTAELEVPLIDLSGMDVAERDRRAAEIKTENGLHRFDLSKAPLIRTVLVKLTASRYELYINVHHIAIDGWGFSVLFRELAAIYEAFANDKPSPLPPPERQYRDAVVWLEQQSQTAAFAGQVEFWKQKLAGPRPDLHFKLDYERPEQSEHQAARHAFTVPPELTAELIRLGRRENASLFMVLAAIWQTRLFRDTGSSDIITGTAIAGRNHPQLENIIGTFINALALRTDFSGVYSFRELLARVRASALAAYANQDVPFGDIMETVAGESRHPVFRNSIILHNMPPPPRRFGGISMTSVEVGNDTSKMDALLYFLERDGQLEGQLEYDSELFAPAHIEQLVHDFLRVARRITEDISRSLEACLAEEKETAPLSCCVIGEGSLCLRSIDILRRSGMKVLCLISPDEDNRTWARKNGVQWHHPRDGINEILSGLSFDYLFSIINSDVLKPEILSMPRRAAINYHDSPLPRYAGMYSTAWALMNGERTHGISWHLMTDIVDAGDILKQKAVDIHEQDTSFTLNARCYDAAAEALSELAVELVEERETRQVQDLSQRTYYSLYQRPPDGGVVNGAISEEKINALRRALDFGNQPNELGLPKVFVDGELYLLRPDGSLYTVDGEETGRYAPVPDSITGNPRIREMVEHLDQMISRTAPHERFWVRQFEGFHELELPDGATRSTQHHALDDLPLFLCFLSRFCSQDAFGVGMSVHPELPAFFMQTLPLCLQFDLDLSLRENMEKAGLALLRVDKHETCSRDLHMRYPALSKRPEYSLTLSKSGVVCSPRLWEHFRTFQRHADMEAPLFSQSVLTDSDLRMLETFERRVPGFGESRCVHQLFEAQVKKSPDAVAVESVNGSLTYAELNRRADKVAGHLRSNGVKPGTPVGLFVNRSPEMCIGILGIRKSGGAYVPLDPDYPPVRIQFIIEDARMPLIASVSALQNQLECVECSVFCIDQTAGNNKAQPLPVDAQNPAYIFYTSGSTGTPKGVVVEHRNVVNHCLASVELYGISSSDRVLQFFSMNFDGSVEELFPAWACGATVVLRTDTLSSSVSEFEEFIAQRRITIVDLPTAYWHEWVRNMRSVPESMRAVIIGGEKVSTELCRVWVQKNDGQVRLFNTYGPTECTVVASVQEVIGGVEGDVTIGLPIAGTEFHVVDSRLQRVPPGMTGELLIGGEGVARGYLNRPELTAEKFIDNPWGEGRLYRTGDRVFFQKDGRVGFVGRVDNQVKIRGFRIEPDEIAKVMEQYAGVAQAIVIARSDLSEHRELAAYWIAEAGAAPEADELREYLSSNLPEYMVPSAFMELDEFPTAPGGKVDRRALPSPLKMIARSRESYVEPSTPLEKVLAEIWSTVLGMDDIGIHDNFFDLGGHSLLAIQLVERVLSSGLELSVAELFQYPSIHAMATLLDERPVGSGAEGECLVRLKKGRPERPPFFLLHSAPGDLFGYSNLVHNLPADQPVYGFQSVGLANPEKTHSTISEMAAYYVSVLNEFMPDGPVLLGGWCYGGYVAMEMARQLKEQQRDVRLLAMIDAWAYPPGNRKLAFYWRRMQLMRVVGAKEWFRIMKEKIRSRAQNDTSNASKMLDGVKTTEGVLANREEVYRRNREAALQYQSCYFPGEITLFRSDEIASSLLPDMTMEWGALTEDLEIHLIPGGHRDLLREPSVKILANTLYSAICDAIERKRDAVGK